METLKVVTKTKMVSIILLKEMEKRCHCLIQMKLLDFLIKIKIQMINTKPLDRKIIKA